MKQRLKNWITSIIGIFIMLGACGWKFLPLVMPELLETFPVISNMEFGTLLVLGWIFLSAKNSLIQGMLGNFIKIKNTGEE